MCLTDVHFIRGEPAAGMPEVVTLGHEVSGTVEAVGSAVDGIAEGTPVVINPVAHMGNATRVVGVHHDGGWAPFAVVPASAVVPVSPALPPEIAAIIPDAVSTPWAALSSTGAVRAAETVAIWGVGGLGYHAVKLARILGAVPVVVVDPLPAARERALAGGADAAFSPESTAGSS
ncbi:alcohol dehydrogenase catalytic domain-containing protein [Blastococcus sp. SYSU D00669]